MRPRWLPFKTLHSTSRESDAQPKSQQNALHLPCRVGFYRYTRLEGIQASVQSYQKQVAEDCHIRIGF